MTPPAAWDRLFSPVRCKLKMSGEVDTVVCEITIAEIRSQFDSEWVLIENPTTDAALNVLGGRVLHHSKDREEVYRTAVLRQPKRSAVVYTGEIPDGTAVVL